MNFDISLFRRPIWLFFDLDDTLWDFKGNSIKALHHVYNTFDIISRKFNSYEDFENEYHLHNAKVWQAFAKGEMSAAFIKTERWRATLFPESSPHNPPGLCSVINDEYLFNLSSYPNLHPYAREILQSLSKKFMIAILSNGFLNTQYRKLNSAGISGFITRVIISEETDVQKPDERFFSYAINETGATGIPVMIGDNPSTDVLGALKAGWRAVWFNPESEPFPFSDSDFDELGIDRSLYLGSFKSLKEIGEVIDAMEQSC